MLRVSKPVEMEEVRREVKGGENGQRREEEEKVEEPGAEGGVCTQTKRLRLGSEVEPEAKRSSR